VAIAAALQGWEGGTGVLVMDEPTAVLPPNEVTHLFEVIDGIKQTGTSVLYVSHRLAEIFELADRVSVIRGGEMVATQDVAAITPRDLATLMVGEDVDPDLNVAIPNVAGAATSLEVRDLRARWLRGASFDLHKGEILGLAGLLGSGREEVPYAIAGALGKDATGTVRLDGGPWRDVADVGGLGMPLVPADRAAEAVIGEFSVGENLSVSMLESVRRRGRIDKRRESRFARDWVALSGGNQQKVVMARCLAQQSSVLLLCEPTAGVDIGTRIALYELIAEEARNGLSVLVTSSDVGEVLAMCTRVLVFRDGVVAREIKGQLLTESAVLHAMEGTDEE
jgi:ribose transport system ATP-binding protein